MESKNYSKIFQSNPYLLGAIIGLILGIFPLNQLFTNMLTIINDIILFIPRLIFNKLIECPLCSGVYFSVVVLSMTSVIVYVLLSLFFVFIIKKIKLSKENNKK